MIPQEIIDRNRNLIRVLQPLTPVLAKMSRWGIPLDKNVLFFKSKDWKRQISDHFTAMFDIVGDDFNVDSSQQVQQVLYRKLNLEPVYEKDRPTANAFALAFLHHKYKEDEKINNFFFHFRRAKLLRHRLSNFVDKFLIFKPCPVCKGSGFTDKSKTNICLSCAKTGFGDPIGYDTHFVSERDGVWYMHPTFLQLAVTGRLNSLDPNVQQYARENKKWKITVRDVVRAPAGYKLVIRDLSKAERLIGAILFNSESVLNEVNLGSKAFTQFAAEAFGVAEEECEKGTDNYTGVKTAAYADQYGVHEETLQKTLMKLDIYMSIEECRDILRFLSEKYSDLKRNIKEFTWKAINRGYINTYQGRLFRIGKPYELQGYNNWQEIYQRGYNSAIIAFEKCCRITSSFVIQGTATGDNLQMMLLKTVDALDRFTRPDFWNPYRPLNGDWTKARIVWPKHDEISVLCREDLVDDVKEITRQTMENIETFEPYLKNPENGIKFNLKSEVEVCEWWDVEEGDVPEAYKQSQQTR